MEVIRVLISLCTGELRHFYIIVTVIHRKQSYFCVSQGNAATLFGWVGRVCNFLGVKCPHNSVQQELLKSVHHSPTNSKHKRGGAFFPDWLHVVIQLRCVCRFKV